jgi:ADP-ribose pyrophosphatase YjhB (NUDIX family)
MKIRIAVRGIIVHDGKLFCLRLKPYNRKTREYYWCTPGGGMDNGESILDALSREMIEETGIEPVIGNLLYIQQFKEKDTRNEQLELFFHITNSQDYLQIDLSLTTHGEEEIEEFAFVDPTKTQIKPTFLMSEKFENLGTQPTKFFSYF